MFSAYTIKKIAPRLLIAAIMIQLSWWVVIEAIAINSEIAHGVEGLFYAPFGGIEKFLSLGNLIQSAGSAGTFGVTSVFLSAAAGGAVFASGGASVLGILALAGTAALGLLIAILTLVLRQAVLLFLVIIAPLAIVAWVLPGTERLWKLWWETFTKLLLVYPLILMAIAAGRIFAYVSASSGGNQMIGFILVVLGFFGPLFMIPALLKLSGSVFNSIAGVANNRSKGMFDRLTKARGSAAEKARERRYSGKTFKGGTEDNFRGRINRGAQAALLTPSVGGFNPTKWRGRVGAAMTGSSIQQRDKMLNDDSYTWKGNDGFNRAVSETNNEQQLRDLLLERNLYDPSNANSMANMERDVANAERMRREYGNSSFKQAAWISAVNGGTAFDGVDQWRAAAAIAGGDDAILSDLVAKGRSASMSAGRVDVGGAGFGDTMGIARQLHERGAAFTDDQAMAALGSRVIRAQGAGTLVHASMKPRAVQNLIPSITDNLDAALASGDNRAIAQALASTAGTLDALGSSSPQLAEIYANGVMNHTTGAAGGNETIGEMIAAYRDDPEFGQMRREMYERQAVAQAAAAAAGQGPGAPPIPPVAPPVGP